MSFLRQLSRTGEQRLLRVGQRFVLHLAQELIQNPSDPGAVGETVLHEFGAANSEIPRCEGRGGVQDFCE